MLLSRFTGFCPAGIFALVPVKVKLFSSSSLSLALLSEGMMFSLFSPEVNDVLSRAVFPGALMPIPIPKDKYRLVLQYPQDKNAWFGNRVIKDRKNTTKKTAIIP